MALLWASPKGLIPIEIYSLFINSWSFLKLANVELPSNNPQQPITYESLTNSQNAIHTPTLEELKTKPSKFEAIT